MAHMKTTLNAELAEHAEENLKPFSLRVPRFLRCTSFFHRL
jgi:hypothetical protein